MGIPSTTGTPRVVITPKATQKKEIQQATPSQLIVSPSFAGKGIFVIEIHSPNVPKISESAIAALNTVTDDALELSERTLQSQTPFKNHLTHHPSSLPPG